MLHENVHVPYKNVETNPCISPSKIIDTTEFSSSGQVSNSGDVTDFHINYFIHPAINAAIINKNNFPSFLNLADVIPVFKKDSKNSKHNYRPKIKNIKNISKVYEKVMCKPIGHFMEKFFSKFQCGFREGYSTQQCLIALKVH